MPQQDFFLSADDDPEAVNRRSEPKRSESDAMDRCQHLTPWNGIQCTLKALKGKQKCMQHDTIGKNERKSRYNLALHSTGVASQMQDPEFTDMTAELSMLRVLLETYWNKCTDANDLFMHGHKIENIVEKIQRVLSMSKKLEVTLGQMVDKNGFSQFTNEVIQIISEEIVDQKLIQRIGARIGESIERAIAKSAASAEERFGS